MQYLTLLSTLIALTSATTTSKSIPLPSASCVPGTSYCAGDYTNIILRCDNGKIQPGNCNDNTGEPVNGAICVSTAPSAAYCSIVGSSSKGSVTSKAPIVTGTGTPVPPPGKNSTLSITNVPTQASSTRSGSPPISTGGAAAAAQHGIAAAGVMGAALLGAVAFL